MSDQVVHYNTNFDRMKNYDLKCTAIGASLIASEEIRQEEYDEAIDHLVCAMAYIHMLKSRVEMDKGGEN